MGYYFQQSSFVLRIRVLLSMGSFLRKIWLSVLGMKVGRDTTIRRLHVTWPHQVSIGNDCKLEYDIYFKYDGIWKEGPSIIINDRVFIGAGCEFNISERFELGSDSLIASGCKFIDHDHATSTSTLIRLQKAKSSPIAIGSNVWLGCNVIVLKGVTIGDGAVVAAGTVVTKSIPSNEIWAGIPGKKIGFRS